MAAPPSKWLKFRKMGKDTNSYKLGVIMFLGHNNSGLNKTLANVRINHVEVLFTRFPRMASPVALPVCDKEITNPPSMSGIPNSSSSCCGRRSRAFPFILCMIRYQYCFAMKIFSRECSSVEIFCEKKYSWW